MDFDKKRNGKNLEPVVWLLYEWPGPNKYNKNNYPCVCRSKNSQKP